MEATVRDLSIFNQLNEHEYEMVSSYASSLIRNRVSEHTEAYYKFQEMRKGILQGHPLKDLSDEELDKMIHSILYCC